MNTHKKLICLICVFVFGLKYASIHGQSVKPIKWSNFTAPGPKVTDGSGNTTPAGNAKKWLQNGTKYALTTWWNTYKNFDAQDSSTYLDFTTANNAGSRSEQRHRESSSMAYTIAIALKTGAYSSAATGVNESVALNRAKKMAVSLAFRHNANSTSNPRWGAGWQTALWAAHAGYAGWLLWDDLSSSERVLIKKMVEYEANRMNNYKVPYFRSPSGKINFPGDSKIEENAWNSYILSLATSMMPGHANYAIWKNKQIELLLSSFARPSDLNSSEVYHGKPLSSWLNGSNIHSDGTVVNHNIIHPDYMAAGPEFNSANMHFLAEQNTPKATFFNSDVIMKAFVERRYVAGQRPYPHINRTVDSPGGTIFVAGQNGQCVAGPPSTTGNVYYPMGSDWGKYRRPNLAMFVANAHVFGFDKTLTNQALDGEYWLRCFAKNVVDMQVRHSDGHTYANNSENNYYGREGQSAIYGARTWMALWIKSQGGITVENNDYTLGSINPGANGIIASWSFDEGNGNQVTDAVGNFASATISGNSGWVTGNVNGALNFDGDNDYIDLSSNGYRDLGGSWTAAMWVKKNAHSHGQVLIGSDTFALNLDKNFSDNVGLTHFGVKDYDNFNYAAPIGTWVHLTFVGTPADVKLYVNGALQSTDPVDNFKLPLNHIGIRKSLKDNDLNAQLDELKLYNVALNASQIQDIYKGSPSATQVPAKIQAEDYVGFFDTTTGNTGKQYRNDDVDIATTSDIGGGHVVGWIANGEWLEYPIEVIQAGEYKVDARVASDTGNGRFTIQIDGVTLGNAISIEDTGGWQTWVTNSTSLGQLSKGKKTLRVQVQSGSFNLNWLDVVKTCKAQSINALSVVSATNQQNTNSASNLYNGNTSGANGTRWSGQGLQSGPLTVVLDMGSSYQITRTELFPYLGRDYKYTFAVSDNASSGFVTVVDRSSNTSGGTSLINDVSSTATGRYLRLQVTGAHTYSGDWSSINEIKVTGNLGSCNSTSTTSRAIIPKLSESSINIVLSPNPVKGAELFIGTREIMNYTIMNILGQKVGQGVSNNGTINVAELKAGIYIVGLHTNRVKLSRRFVKK